MPQVYFAPNDLGDFGFELYSGEAMLALMTAYQRLGQERYLASVQRAMPQYERIYRQAGAGAGGGAGQEIGAAGIGGAGVWKGEREKGKGML
jgi:hypothetical protein